MFLGIIGVFCGELDFIYWFCVGVRVMVVELLEDVLKSEEEDVVLKYCLMEI